jgi:hypothetical protein
MLGKSDALLDLGGHSHWVWRAQFSPFHDQLIASSSSDSHVNLYFIPKLAASGGSSGTDTGAAAQSDTGTPTAAGGGAGGTPR